MNIRMIISPAKKMVTDNDWLAAEQMPCFLDRTEKIRAYLDHLSYEELKQRWGCSDKLARGNEQRLRQMRLTEHLTPALLAYEGIQYQYMAPRVFTDDQWDYVRSHLRILSGFYGVLRPTDGVVPYRLEMQAKARVDGAGDLYEFWGADICREVSRDADVILNLASKEYSRCVEAYAREAPPVITCVFGEKKGEKVVQKATLAKMARGEMVRYLAECGAEDLDAVRKFRVLDFQFAPELSGDDRYVFLRNHPAGQTME